MTYRAKPVVVEAWRWEGDLTQAPEWIHYALRYADLYLLTTGDIGVRMIGENISAPNGSWIVRHLNGDLSVVRDDVFRATYEEVTE